MKKYYRFYILILSFCKCLSLYVINSHSWSIKNNAWVIKEDNDRKKIHCSTHYSVHGYFVEWTQSRTKHSSSTDRLKWPRGTWTDEIMDRLSRKRKNQTIPGTMVVAMQSWSLSHFLVSLLPMTHLWRQSKEQEATLAYLLCIFLFTFLRPGYTFLNLFFDSSCDIYFYKKIAFVHK